MAAAVRVRRDYEAAQIRVLAKRSKNAAQTRRLLALAAIYDGGSRTEAARIGGVGVRTGGGLGLGVKTGGAPGFGDGKGPGEPPPLHGGNPAGLCQDVPSGPVPGGLRPGPR